MKVKYFFWCCWFLLSWPLLSVGAEIRAIKINESLTLSDIKIMLDNTTSAPHIYFLSKPRRLVCDFSNTHLGVNLKKLPLTNKDILAIREGYPNVKTLRLVFDLTESAAVKFVTSKTSVQILVTRNLPKPVVAIIKHDPPKVSIKPFVIVIDPGHGGKDPGAVGQLGTFEKDVVLKLAKQLANRINQEPNMRAILTRSQDRFVSLKQRLLTPRRYKADLFVALHADSYFNKHANGASVYALSKHGATSVAARWIATKENHSELGNVVLGGLTDQSYQLRSVLIDLAQTATIRDSLQLGHNLLRALQKVTVLHYARVEQAPFLVLKSPDIPSILVEVGFISNRQEEQRLGNDDYQQKIVLALFRGINNYRDQLSNL